MALSAQPDPSARKRRRGWIALIASVLFIAVAIASVALIPSPTSIDTTHVTGQPAPGSYSLPPTPTATAKP
jgi:hypothetical protein